jgi:hypothetical protein
MNKLAEYLRGFTLGKYINASQKTELETFKDDLSDAKYKKIRETLIAIIDSKNYTKKISDNVNELLESLKKCHKKKNVIK